MSVNTEILLIPVCVCDQSDPWSLILICLLIYDPHLPTVTKTHKMDDTLRHLHQYIVDF